MLICDMDLSLVSNSDCQCVKSQTFSLSKKSDVSVALECETKMNMEGSSVKAVSEAVRNGPALQSSPFKAVPEWIRSRPSPPPEVVPLQQTVTLPGPPMDAPVEADEIEMEDRSLTWSSMSITPGIRGSTSLAEEWKTTLQRKVRKS